MEILKKQQTEGYTYETFQAETEELMKTIEVVVKKLDAMLNNSESSF